MRYRRECKELSGYKLIDLIVPAAMNGHWDKGVHPGLSQCLKGLSIEKEKIAELSCSVEDDHQEDSVVLRRAIWVGDEDRFTRVVLLFVPDLIFRRVANILLDQVLPPHVNDCLTIGVAIMPSVVVRVDFWEVKLVVIGLCLWSIVLPRGGKGPFILDVNLITADLKKIFHGTGIFCVQHDVLVCEVLQSIPRGNDKVNHNSFKLVLGDLVGVDMMGGVDGPSFDSVRCLSSFQVDDVDQRFGAVPVPFHTLKHVVKKVHSCAAHVDGDRVEEEDCVVLRHTELVDHRAVRNMEAFANLLRNMEAALRISVQVESLPNTRNTLNMIVEHVIGARFWCPVGGAHSGAEFGIVVANPLQAGRAEDVHFGKICGCDELISHLGDCYNGVVRVAAYFWNVPSPPVIP